MNSVLMQARKIAKGPGAAKGSAAAGAAGGRKRGRAVDDAVPSLMLLDESPDGDGGMASQAVHIPGEEDAEDEEAEAGVPCRVPAHLEAILRTIVNGSVGELVQALNAKRKPGEKHKLAEHIAPAKCVTSIARFAPRNLKELSSIPGLGARSATLM